MDKHTLRECIDACLRCASACNYCASACLKEEHVSMMTRCIQLDMECAAICYASAQVMSIGGSRMDDLNRICIAICQSCGEECVKHDNDHCRECALMCSECVAVMSQKLKVKE